MCAGRKNSRPFVFCHAHQTRTPPARWTGCSRPGRSPAPRWGSRWAPPGFERARPRRWRPQRPPPFSEDEEKCDGTERGGRRGCEGVLNMRVVGAGQPRPFPGSGTGGARGGRMAGDERRESKRGGEGGRTRRGRGRGPVVALALPALFFCFILAAPGGVGDASRSLFPDRNVKHRFPAPWAGFVDPGTRGSGRLARASVKLRLLKKRRRRPAGRPAACRVSPRAPNAPP